MADKGGFDIDESLLIPEGIDTGQQGAGVRKHSLMEQPYEASRPATVLDLVIAEKRVLSRDKILDLAAEAGIRPGAAKKELTDLVSTKKVVRARSGRQWMYWASRYRFIASEWLTGDLLVVSMQVTEGEAWKSARRELPGFFTKSGELAAPPVLKYLPIFRIDLRIDIKPHWYSSKKESRMEYIYVDGYKGRVCRLTPRRGLQLELVTPQSPEDIRDFDDYGKIEHIPPGDLDVDFGFLKKILKTEEIDQISHRKFLKKTDDIRLLLVPYWRFQVKTDEETRIILIDGIFGQHMQKP